MIKIFMKNNGNNSLKKSRTEVVLDGYAISPGIALGYVYVFRRPSVDFARLDIRSTDVNREIDLFSEARQNVKEQLESARLSSETHYGKQFSDIFDSQKAFLDDPILIKEIEDEIRNTGQTSVSIISKILSQKSDYFINLENIYFRERAFDIIDLKQKLLHAILGIHTEYLLSSPSIVIAESLSPSDTINFNRNFLLGFLTDQGGKTSHAAILARSLKIPAVVNRTNLSKLLLNDDYVIIDGFEGKIVLNPDKKTMEHYREVQKEHIQFEGDLFKQVKEPSITLDNKQIKLLANIEFDHEIADVKRNRADGVGLFRTEGMYLENQNNPSEKVQYKVYKKLVEHLSPQTVIIRTIDLGGDKIKPGYGHENELNPFLGWRAIRFCLDTPDVFKTQLRALLRASAHGNLKILLPMVSCVDEILLTKELICEVQQELDQKGKSFNKDVPIGIMIETPSAAITANILAEYVDFFSIGTNDLTQYVLAIDRTNDKVARSCSAFNPAVVELIAKTVKAANRHNIDVSLCGELGSVPEAIPLLLGLGLRCISVNPHALPEVKKIVRSLDTEKCDALYKSVKKLHTARQIEIKCQAFLKANVPNLKFIK